MSDPFAAANKCLGHAVAWHPLDSEGTTNTLYVGEICGQHYVLRINANSRLAFGVDRSRETAVLSAITPRAWAPDVLLTTANHGACLMRYHPDELNGARPSPRLVHKLLTAVAEWQQLPDIPEFDYLALWKQYETAIDALAPARQPGLKAQLAAICDLQANLPPAPTCLTHHDLHPGNLRWADGHLVIIDWEYAGAGSPWFDAAALSQACGVDDEAIAALPAFTALTPAHFHRGLNGARTLATALERLWWAVRQG